MDQTLLVDVEWDAEAQVWTAASDAFGLFTEADTLDEVRKRVSIIASDLLEAQPSRSVRLHVELLVRFDEIVPAAA